MNRFSFLILSSAFIILSCNKKAPKSFINEDIIITEKDLIPEGVAFDTITGVLYIGSTHKRKIIAITPQGKIKDFYSYKKDTDIWSPTGMEVDEARGILWVNNSHANEVMPLLDPHKKEDWMTSVIAFDTKQRKLLKSYSLNKPKVFFNDLTVLPNGDVYITESITNKVYRIKHEKDNLEVFLKPEGFSFLNGITYDQSTNTLFVSSTQGIINIDPNTKEYKLIDTPNSINAKGIDGLTYYDNMLIGHQSIKVSKFYLNKNRTAITEVELLDSGEEFDSSTTGEIGLGSYHFIVNSQIRSGVNYKERSIQPIDSLDNIIIRRLKIN
ncbi:hypothetical protein [Leptobacterium sp. I13]|uniref:hypothetical protein n=1 Tax=Leptobacterium meishanense TaxID=3128904 RepID=UPI0030ED5FCB